MYVSRGRGRSEPLAINQTKTGTKMETNITTSKKQVKERNNNRTLGGKNNVDFACFGFTIVGKTKKR